MQGVTQIANSGNKEEKSGVGQKRSEYGHKSENCIGW